MSSDNSYYNPAIEDENFFRYQKQIDYCFNHIQDNPILEEKELYILIAYLARLTYDMGYTDGLVAEIENKIYN